MSNSDTFDHSNDIAVVGMACRLPEARDIDEFWQNLRSGVESITFFSDEELVAAGIDPAVVSARNYVKAGGILEDIDMFDASFFGFTPREAEIMDPQHRIFMETAWEALEQAGYNPDIYRGQIGIYAGVGMNTYLPSGSYNTGSAADLFQVAIGNEKEHLATHTSYKLNLKGPSVSISTACSTSLVAIHLACQSLLNGECDMSLAGGVAIRAAQKVGYLYQVEGIASPDGHCRAFDAQAQGTVPGNGVGVVILKRLNDALADGDCIHAVIKGSAMNNDGSLKIGYTAPSLQGQAAVIAEAQAVAGVEPEEITYIEAHGTGTPLGDPIEVAALTKVFRARTQKKSFCAIGSVKTNIGHLDTATGVVGFIKTVLALKHCLIPPSLHFEQPNPKIDFVNSPFYVNTALSEWNTSPHPRRAGVSSFGLGGTNVHMILEEAPVVEKSAGSNAWLLLVLSAQSASALRAMTQNLTEHLKQNADLNLADVAYTLQIGRKTFGYRQVAVCRNSNDAIHVLGTPDSARTLRAFQDISDRQVAFLFPGVGDHYVHMAWGLYQAEPLFRKHIDHCAELLKPYLKLDLRDVLYPDIWHNPEQSLESISLSQKPDLVKMLLREESNETAHLLNETRLTQPAVFVIEYSLARLWIEWTGSPKAMAGYSLGEYVAACLAGVISLEDALFLVAKRAQLIHTLPAGAMLAVPLPESEIQNLLGASLSIAAVNTSSLCVVSGPLPAIDELEEELLKKDVLCRKLQTSHAFHSKMMLPIADAFVELLKTVKLKAPTIPYLSNVTGTWITPDQATNPQYWVRHMCQTVRFADSVHELFAASNPALLEVGPGQTLSSLVMQGSAPAILAERTILPSLRYTFDSQPDMAFLLSTLGRLWLAGVQVNWSRLYAKEQRFRVPLPTYPFERQRYWIEPKKQTVSLPTVQKSQAKRPDVSDWFYLPSWKRSPLHPPLMGSLNQKRCWLVFVDAWGIGSALTKLLKDEEQDVTTVIIGNAFSRLAEKQYTLNPREQSGYEALFQELHATKNVPSVIVHCWSISASQAHVRPDIEEFREAQHTGFYSLLFLAQVLGKYNITEPLQMRVVSNHIHDLESKDFLDPIKATLLGPCKVIPQEYTNITCQCIDIALPGTESPKMRTLLAQLMEELHEPLRDAMVAYRGMHRWVQIFEEFPLENNGQPTRLRQKGVYLIVGGLGMIGFYFAKWLAQSTQARLILTGRSELPPKAEWQHWLATHDKHNRISTHIRKVQELEQIGADVLVINADATDSTQMRDAIDRSIERFGTLNGVIYSAGVASEKNLLSIQGLEYSDCELHFHPKVYGSLVLEEALSGYKIDFCLLLSSLSATLGGLQLTPYASANIYLDAYTHYHNRVHDVPWISVDWDGYATPEETIDAMQRILSLKSIEQIVVSTGDLYAKLDQWITPRPLREGQEKPTQYQEASHYPRPHLPNTYVAPSNELERVIVDTWQAMMGIEQVGVHDNFFALGGHSLLATQIVTQLRKVLQLELPLRTFLETPTVTELAETVLYLRTQAQVAQLPPLVPVARTQDLPLSFAQQRLWFLNQLEPGNTAYTILVVIQLDGLLDLRALENSLQAVIQRHDILRTTFHMKGTKPVQIIDPAGHVCASIVDLNGLPWEQREAETITLRLQQAQLPFDLVNGPLLRMMLLRLSKKEHSMILPIHHIVTDGWSNDVLFHELRSLYNAYVSGQPSLLPALPIQYVDFAHWQRQWLQGEVLQVQLDYWTRQLHEITTLELPTDHPRPAMRTFHGAHQFVYLPTSLSNDLQELSRHENVTLFMTLLAAFQLLLARYSGQTDLSVGTSIANRTRSELEGLMGFFVNTLVLRTDLSRNPTFQQLLARVREVCLGAYAHQDVPFEQLVGVLKPERDMSRSPLFQIMFALQNTPEWVEAWQDLTLNIVPSESATAKFDLTLSITETQQGLHCGIEYNTDLFNASTISQLVEHFQILLEGIVAYPERHIDDLSLVRADSLEHGEMLPANHEGNVEQAISASEGSFVDFGPLFVAPRTHVEELVAGIWCELLQRPRISIHENFFALGGHSLLATQFIAHLRMIMQVELPLRSLFEFPTIAGLAEQVELIWRGNEQSFSSPPLMPVPRTPEMELSFAQQRLWFLHQLDPQNMAYLQLHALYMHGVLHVEALERSMKEVIMRHESLRTTFHTHNSHPVQVIHPTIVFHMLLIDLLTLSTDERQQEIHRLFQQESQQSFDLEHGPLVRMYLLRLEKETHFLLLTLHHIVSDGWSMLVMQNELIILYRAFLEGKPSPLKPLPIQYVDFALWQRQQLQGQVLETQLTYWKRQLTGITPLELPTSYPRPAEQTYAGARQWIDLPRRLSEELATLSRQEGVTLFMLLLASFQVLLARYSGQSDISVGTPIANRTRAELEEQIGFFVNTLVLRCDMSGDPTFSEMLEQVREVCLGAYAHQDLPFERLVEALQPERDLSRSPLFQVMFILHNAHGLPETLQGLTVTNVPNESVTAKFDLTLSIMEMERYLRCEVEYNTDLFAAPMIHRLMEHFQILLEGIVANPTMNLAQLPLLSQREQQQILLQWNATHSLWLCEQRLHEMVQTQVRCSPDAIAVLADGAALSYQHLNERSNQLAHFLRQLGVGPEVVVGVLLERSLWLSISLLAILKAGGAYLPLDLSYPTKRLAFMLSKSQAPFLLTVQALQPQATAITATLPFDQQEAATGSEPAVCQVIVLDHAWQEGWKRLEHRRIDPISQQARENPKIDICTENAAYVIYTSGSTGEPKGVINTHRGICNRLQWMQETYQLHAEDRVLQKTPTSFDVSVWELFWPLLAGAQLVMAQPQGHRDSGYLVQVIQEQAISVLHFVPSMLQVFLEEAEIETCESVRLVIASGEALTVQIQARFFERMGEAGLHNLYGPTEAAIDVSSWECERGSQQRSVPIGRPISNIQLYVLDGQMQPVPIGVVGELYIGGVGVARGYMGRADLTAERFVPHLYGNEGERLYRTGDLVKYREDGVIEYLRRVDQQVKLRGYRIELREIEATLRQQPIIHECVVLIREDTSGIKRLIAYVLPTEPSLLQIEELRTVLQQRLPDYMIPSVFVVLDALSLTESGKIDRRALPAPGIVSLPSGQEVVVPRTEVECLLAAVWSQVLGIAGMSIHENFFALGGDSILSLQIVVKARQVGLPMTPKLLFQHPTIASLAAAIAQTRHETLYIAEQGLMSGPVPLTPIQQWFFAQQLNNPQHFNQAVLLCILRPLDLQLLARALYHVYMQHDALRLRFFPQGEQRWQQLHVDPEREVPLSVISLAHLEEDEQHTALAAEVASLQASLHLQQGPLMRAGYFDMGTQQPARLLLVIHHLLVDGVSWRILLEDLQQAYEHLEQGRVVQLAAKTTSFQYWARSLQTHAVQEHLQQEASYWQRVLRHANVTIPIDEVRGENTVGSSQTITSLLDQEQTRLLLYEVPRTYHTQINDILLTAFAQTLAAWMGEDGALLHLEGHGRNPFLTDIDLSRTIGWFTSLYPVWLELYPDGLRTQLSTQIKSVKEQLHQIPFHGINYGLLRYMCEDTQIVEQMHTLPEPQIIFNYLGQLDQSFSQKTLFDLAPESSGPSRDPSQKRLHLLEVSGGIIGGQLQMNWTYSQNIHHDQTIASLAEHYQQALRALIAHCCSSEVGEYTPSDFPLTSLKQQQLDVLLAKRTQVEDIYPLSPLQEGLLFHTLYHTQSGVYVTQLAWNFAGFLHMAAFEQAWQQAIERHSILRTAFVWDGESRFLQVVAQKVLMPLLILDWRNLSSQEREKQQADLWQADRMRGFVLEKAPLMRLTVIYEADERIAVLWSHHHLLLDGWSLPRLLDDVLSTYRQLCKKQVPAQRRYRPYRDYIAWLQEQDLEQAKRFWRRYLNGFTSPTRLMADHLVTNMDHPAMIHTTEIAMQVNQEVTMRLREQARQRHLTLNTVLQGTWAILLNRYSGDRDVIFGTTVAGRPAVLDEVETMVGLFINTLPVRIQIEPQMGFWEWLPQLQEQQMEARQYEYAPLVKIQEWSQVPQGQPLFESLLIFENYPVEASIGVHLRELEIRDVRVIEQTNYPLTLRVSLQEETLRFFALYDPTRFEAATIQRLLNHWQTLLESIVVAPATHVAQLPLLNKAEQHLMLEEWNATQTASSSEQWLYDLVQAQIERSPDAIALSDDNSSITYHFLNEQVERLVHFLRQMGAGPEVIVGVLLERSLWLNISLLAILKAGSAYLPLDLSYPPERLAFMLRKSQASLLLTNEVLHKQAASIAVSHSLEDLEALAETCRVISLDQAWGREKIEPPSQRMEEDGVRYGSAENAAYVIYTSGSTGEPKGVVVNHRCILNFFTAMDNLIDWTTPGVWLAVTSISFDISVLELFWTLTRGFCVVVNTGSEARSSQARVPVQEDVSLCGQIIRYGVTHLQGTPSLMRALLLEDQAACALSRLQNIFVGGEAFPPLLAQQIESMTKARLWNMYGPTETTVWSATHLVQGEERSIPIGRPIANTQLYVFDRYMQPVPIGVVGELYIGGLGVVRGYHRRTDLTAERFVPNPYGNGRGGERLYRTGDLVRYREDGALEYLGRTDHQVKLRGYRIELGEIEAVLQKYEGIRENVVIVREDRAKDKRLVGYVVAKATMQLSSKDIRRHVQQSLPDYMVPAAIVVLEALPLTANGKVDRHKLPALEDLETGQAIVRRPFSPLEEVLLQVWSEVLGGEQKTIHEDFFEQGGHSLLAMQMIGRLKKILQVEIPVRSVFEAPTVAKMALYVERQLGGGQRVEAPPLVASERPVELPLSFAQQRLWFLDQLEPGSTAYLIPAASRVSGNLKIAAFEWSIQEIVRRHESLRTTFQMRENRPIQVITPAYRLSVPLIDLQELLPEEQEQQAWLLAKQEAQQPCDLAHGPLVRIWILRLQAQEHILLTTLHHIVSDAWSMDIFAHELNELYRAFVTQQPSSLALLPIQYADFALWQRQWLQNQVMEAQLSYWRQQLEGSVPLELPTDHPRPLIKSNKGAVQSLSLSADLYESINSLSKQEGVTPFMLFFAAFVVLLFRHSGQSDISVGTPIANRTQPELESLIGFFVNTLVLRIHMADNPRFVDLLSRVREMALVAYTHQDVPFEYLVEQLQPERDLNRSPFFQVMFNHRQLTQAHFDKQEELIMREFDVQQVSVKLDLIWTVVSTPQHVQCVVEYSTDLFEKVTIQRLLHHWQTLLEGLAAAPQTRLCALPLLSTTERTILLQDWNPPTPLLEQGEHEMSLHRLFETQVSHAPERIALVDGENQLTYDFLNRRANQLAHTLRQHGIGTETLVGLCLPRGLSLLIGLLGILKAGGAYVPLDPSYPQERLTFQVQDAHLSLIVTVQEHLTLFADGLATEGANRDIALFCLDRDEAYLHQACDHNPSSVPEQGEALAYIIYTSGSTGTPKGVQVTHANAVRLFLRTERLFEWCEDEVWTQFHSSSFDFSVWEIWGCLLYGGRLLVVPYWVSRSSEDLYQMVRERGVTVLNQTPSAFRQLQQVDEKRGKLEELSLRFIIFGGEALEMGDVRSWIARHGDRQPRLVNMYGITETTVHVTAYQIKQEAIVEEQTSVIGRPIEDLQLYVLDAWGQIVPVGVPGELYVGGAGVARGYLGRGEVTAERFLPDPFGKKVGGRLYRTGDRVRYRRDGALEYLGRVDEQVKIRGYRIELGEIEAVLRRNLAIREAVVAVQGDDVLEKRLIAYVVTTATQTKLSSQQLRRFVQEQLPEYMVPALIVFLDALPLTPNGKLDYQALSLTALKEPELSEHFVSPRTPAEEVVAMIWADALGVKQISIYDNFFDLGGHSLLATQVISRLCTVFQVDLPLRMLFEFPTVESIIGTIANIYGTREIVDEIAQVFLEIEQMTEEEMELDII